MINIETIFQDVLSKEGWGNVEKPRLKVQEIACVTEKKCGQVIFGFDYDYSTDHNKIIDTNIIKAELKKYKMLMMCEDYDGNISSNVCYMYLSRQNILEMLCQIVAATYIPQVFGKGSYKDVTFINNGRNTNVGKFSHSVYFTLNEQDLIIPVDTSCRFNENHGINDLVYSRNKYLECIKKFQGEEKMKSYIMEALDWHPEKDDFSYKELHNCFVYEVFNDHAVLMKIRKELNPKFHLLQFDHFLDMYDMFKIEYVGGSTYFSMYRTWNEKDSPFIIKRGNGTSMVDERFWKMLNALEKCIQVECLIYR